MPLLLAPMLFLGPLYSEVFLERMTFQNAWQALAAWTGVRNYVVVRLIVLAMAPTDVEAFYE